MPKQLPDPIRPYDFHGVNFNKSDGKEAIADCPFCYREGKFTVNIESGQYQCWACGGGNVYTFLRQLHEQSLASPSDYEGLAEEKNLDEEELEQWEITQSLTTENWLVPGFNEQGNLVQLYKLVRRKLLATSTLGHGLHGVNLFDKRIPTVYICEGIWDGVAIRKRLKSTNVLSVPGANVWKEKWNPLLKGRNVVLLFDNDDAGIKGMKAFSRKVWSDVKNRPKSVKMLNWSKVGDDLPKGYDVRDYLTGV